MLFALTQFINFSFPRRVREICFRLVAQSSVINEPGNRWNFVGKVATAKLLMKPSWK